MRWRRIAGWDIAGHGPVVLRDAPGGGIAIVTAEVSLDWADLLLLFDGFDDQISSDNHTRRRGPTLTRDVYSLPHPTATNASTIAAQERQVLKDLLEMRLGLASMHAGHVKVSTRTAPKLSACRSP